MNRSNFQLFFIIILVLDQIPFYQARALKENSTNNVENEIKKFFTSGWKHHLYLVFAIVMFSALGFLCVQQIVMCYLLWRNRKQRIKQRQKAMGKLSKEKRKKSKFRKSRKKDKNENRKLRREGRSRNHSKKSQRSLLSRSPSPDEESSPSPSFPSTYPSPVRHPARYTPHHYPGASPPGYQVRQGITVPSYPAPYYDVNYNRKPMDNPYRQQALVPRSSGNNRYHNTNHHNSRVLRYQSNNNSRQVAYGLPTSVFSSNYFENR